MIFTWFEDFTKQASKTSHAYNWLSSCQWTFTTRDYPQSFNPSVSQHLQSLKDKDYKWIVSHTMCLITNECSMCELKKQKQVQSSIIVLWSIASSMTTLGSVFVWIELSLFMVEAEN